MEVSFYNGFEGNLYNKDYIFLIDAFNKKAKDYELIPNILIKGSKNLINWFISKYYPSYLATSHYEDLLQECNLAIFENFAKYTPNKGKFGTFIGVYLKHNCSAYLNSHNQISIHFSSALKSVNKAFAEFEKQDIKNVSISDICRATGLSPKTVEGALTDKDRLNNISLDDSNNSLVNKSHSFENVEKNIEDAELKNILKQAIDGLSPVEREIMALTFYGDTEKTVSVAQISRTTGYKTSEIKRIKQKAICKISKNECIKEFLGVKVSVNDKLNSYIGDIQIDYGIPKDVIDEEINFLKDIMIDEF